ncbi:MAG: Holliday junction branch migration protein RuvA [Candidatus Manganitrophaceae bacterium]
MIAMVTGTLVSKGPTGLVVETQGIGYHLFIPFSTFYRLPEIKEAVSLHAYLHVREDALQLYGFLTLMEKELFLLFLGINGVGPKLALSLLSGMEVSELIHALRQGSVERLRAIPGVGPKTAARLVLELKEKVNALVSTDLPTSVPEPSGLDKTKEDALSALINLGYSRNEAKRAIDATSDGEAASSDLPNSPNSIEERIKKALKMLSKGGS